MTYSESPFSQLSDELWHVFGGRRRFPTTRGGSQSRIWVILRQIDNFSPNVHPPLSLFLQTWWGYQVSPISAVTILARSDQTFLSYSLGEF